MECSICLGEHFGCHRLQLLRHTLQSAPAPFHKRAWNNIGPAQFCDPPSLQWQYTSQPFHLPHLSRISMTNRRIVSLYSLQLESLQEFYASFVQNDRRMAWDLYQNEKWFCTSHEMQYIHAHCEHWWFEQQGNLKTQMNFIRSHSTENTTPDKTQFL